MASDSDFEDRWNGIMLQGRTFASQHFGEVAEVNVRKQIRRSFKAVVGRQLPGAYIDRGSEIKDDHSRGEGNVLALAAFGTHLVRIDLEYEIRPAGQDPFIFVARSVRLRESAEGLRGLDALTVGGYLEETPDTFAEHRLLLRLLVPPELCSCEDKDAWLEFDMNYSDGLNRRKALRGWRIALGVDEALLSPAES